MSPFFGQLIKSFREQRGWSQEQLALITGLSDRTIQRIENKMNSPSNTSLMALANAFDIPFEEMKTLVERPPLFDEQTTQILEHLQDADLIPRVVSGHNLIYLMTNAYALQFHRSPLQNSEQAKLIGQFIQDIQDYGDL